jgi:hypothetical protein
MISFNPYQSMTPLGQISVGALAVAAFTAAPISQSANAFAFGSHLRSYSINEADSSATQHYYSKDWAKDLFVRSASASFLQRTLAEINQLRKLQDDWDSYGSQKPSELALNMIEQLAKKLTNSPVRARTKVGASAEAGLYWESEKGYLDVSIGIDKKFVIYHADSSLTPISYYEGRDFIEAATMLANKVSSM